LDKGADFWSRIEREIREHSCKFLIVSSAVSNQREGVLKELAVAAKVKKKLEDETFIIPLAIDDSLSYDDINIEIVRLNAIDFKKSWATGLQDLLEALEKQNTPKSDADHSKSNSLYQQIFLHNKGIVEKFEKLLNTYFSSDKPNVIGLPSVAYYAGELNLSANYFGDLIKKETGKSAQEYIQNKIIETAKNRIFDSTKTINEVAYELGFKYPQHFTRFFKQHVGSTPNEYRSLN